MDRVTLDARVNCVNCGRPLLLPLKHDWSSPLYVMHMEREHEMLKEILSRMHKDLIELAEECVEAGVRPSMLKRADAVNAQLKAWKRRFGLEP